MVAVIKFTGISFILLMLQACTSQGTEQQRLVMRNPASVWCVQQGGELVPASTPNDSSHYCLLPGGERIEQWALFHRDHPQ